MSKKLIYLLLFSCFLLDTSYAMAIEEPKFTVVTSRDGVEYRQYEAYMVAATLIAGENDRDTASSQGFRRLFKYISGDNTPNKSISMTAPVQQTPVLVQGDAIMQSNIIISGNVYTTGYYVGNPNVNVEGNLVVSGNIIAMTNVVVQGHELSVAGNVVVGSNLIVTHEAVISNGNVIVQQHFIVINNMINANNDTQAATSGVPLHGLYRNGSTVQIRVT
jgi:UDP-3-O-[3-hydroxymyristoyl] glucosamine N-acyltransferase